MAAARTAHRLTRAGVVLLALLAMVALALSVWSLRATARADDTQVRAGVLQAARQETVNLFSVGYSTFDRDSKRVLDGATGDFQQQFQARLDEFKQTLTAGKWQTQGQVLDAGVLSLDGRIARVLVAADQTTSGPSLPKGQLKNYRLELTLVREHGQWLVSTLQMGT